MDLLNSNSKYSVEQILDENDYNFSEVGESAFFSSNESDSDCIYANESDDDNQSASCSQMDSDLHPFAYVSTASAMQEFLELIRRSQIIKDNPLHFWSSELASIKFPVLKCLARKLYSIPATSAGTERLFSYSGIILNNKRQRLSPDQLDNIHIIRSARK
ncbi:unnamed protein product, partial [Rotaria magnacalcarata]